MHRATHDGHAPSGGIPSSSTALLPRRTNLSTTSLAIYDRAAESLVVSRTHVFLDADEQTMTAQLLDRYRIALLPG